MIRDAIDRLCRLLSESADPCRPHQRTGLRLERLEDRETPAFLAVNTTADTDDANLNDGKPLDANGKVSLRAWVQQANDTGNFPEVIFDPMVFSVPQTIFLTRAMDPFVVNLSVLGPGKDNLFIVGGADSFGMFTVTEKYQGAFSDLTLRDGLNRNINGNAALGKGTGWGGAIDNRGTLTLDGVRISGCAAGEGGAVYTNGPFTASNCEFVQNRAIAADGGHGGAILVDKGVTTISNSQIRDNRGESNGGGIGIRNTGEVGITDTDLLGNWALWGGGVYNSVGTSFKMTGGLLQGNTCDKNGAGLHQSGGTSTFDNVNISGNKAAGWGGAAHVAGAPRAR
jgi:hypothetical protein